MSRFALGLSLACSSVAAANTASNGVLSLDSGGRVEVPHHPSQSTNSAVTIEFWVRMDSGMVQQYGRPFAKRHGSGGQFSVNMLPRSTSGVELFGISDLGGWTCPTNQWVHFATTWSSASQKHRVYINGEQVAETTTPAWAVSQWDGSLSFGDTGDFGTWRFQGRLDNIRYWNVERTRDQIRAHATHQLTPARAASIPGLIGSWTFDNLDAADGTGVNNGTARSGAVFALDAAWTGYSDCNLDSIPDAWQPGMGPLSLTAPVDGLSLLPGTTAVFTASVSGPASSYQWFKDGPPLIDNARISGSTTSTLQIVNVTDSDQGFYSAKIEGGCSTIETNAAPLSCKPIILQSAPAATPQKRTLALTLGVPANAPYTYAWRRNGVPIANLAGVYSGAFTNTLRILSPDFARGGTFDCVLTDVCGQTVSASTRVCLADFNLDTSVDDTDFVTFARDYDTLLCSDPAMSSGCFADFNNDTVVDDADFLLFAAAYNELLCP